MFAKIFLVSALACSATATNLNQHESNTPSQLAQIKSEEGFLITGSALVIYKTAKTTADTVCMIWAERKKILKALKAGAEWAKKALKKFKGAMKAGKKMKKLFTAAKDFFKSKAGKALLKGVKNAGKKARKLAKKAKKAAKKKLKKVGKKLKKFFPQVAAASDAQAAIENAEAEDLMMNWGKVSDVAVGVAEVMMKVIGNSPFSDKLDASVTITNFIKDRINKKKMKWQEVVDVACAINTLLPSEKQLAKAIFKSKKGVKAVKSAKSVKKVGKLAKTQAKKAGKKTVKASKKAVKKAAKKAKKEMKKYVKKCVKEMKTDMVELLEGFAQKCLTGIVMGQKYKHCRGLDEDFLAGVKDHRCVKDARNWYKKLA